MTELPVSCWRSLWATLIAAASTCGLFASANWGLAALIGDTQNAGFVKQIASHCMFSFTMPYLASMQTLSNAFKVSIVRKALQNFYKEAQNQLCPHAHSSISIITLCPIYIETPEIESNDQLIGEHLAHYKSVTALELKKLHPLQLPPANDGANADNNLTDRWMYFQVPQSCGIFDYKDAEERYALLASGLVPEKSELEYVRARNLFQSMVILVQAIGYVLGVIERMMEHLDISPVEGIVTYLSILAAVQVVIEMYACGKFQRPLLLRLHRHQLHRFFLVPRKDLKYLFTPVQDFLCIAHVIASATLVSVPSLAYARAYPNTICALDAFLFWFASMVSGLCSGLAFACSICSFMFVSTIILAVVSTIVEWKMFKKLAKNPWAYLFPHLSS